MIKKEKESNCIKCTYPLRKNSKVCPNCGNIAINKNILNSKIKNEKIIQNDNNTKTSEIKKQLLIKCFDKNKNEININDIIRIEGNIENIAIKRISKNVMILRPLKIGDILKHGDILIDEKSEIFNITIK